MNNLGENVNLSYINDKIYKLIRLYTKFSFMLYERFIIFTIMNTTNNFVFLYIFLEMSQEKTISRVH